ncbi:uncharacterized protein G2W53_004424 [Senna tora]|uniref:Uncharacterized protein n=1 Tax=Senna tora TaxID=362788 RepID=A0A835CGG9_9FABA|nr:uncharacterized protein G2W53_004424 [Senna tora]
MAIESKKYSRSTSLNVLLHKSKRSLRVAFGKSSGFNAQMRLEIEWNV